VAAASFGARAVYIYMKDVACVLLIEGDGKAAIMMIILSMRLYEDKNILG